MNIEPENKKSGAPDNQSLRALLKTLPGRFWRMLRHNWAWKLLALFLAVCLWAGLITQDPTLTRERVFNDVPVSVQGADVLLRNGMIVLNDFEAEPLTIRLRADVPQREYNTVLATHYNPRIDLSRITSTGTQTLRILTTSTTTYGTVRELSVDSVEVTVDEYYTNYRVPVSINREGAFPGGFYGSSPSLDPSSVFVSGPKSIVEKVARVVVDFDVSKLAPQAGLSRTAAPMRIVDVDGNDIASDLLDITSAGVLLRTIVVEQTLYPTKTLPISSLSLTEGEPAEGYEIKSVTATPNILVAAGDPNGLNALETLFLEQAVDISGVSESFSKEVKIRKPSELVYLSADSVMLYVEVAPVMASREFTDIPLRVEYASSGSSASCEQRTVTVTLTGPETELASLKSSALEAYVDANGLALGPHDLPVALKISGADEKSFTYSISPKTVTVEVAAE